MPVLQSRIRVISRRAVTSRPNAAARLSATSPAEAGTAPSEGTIKGVGGGLSPRVRAAGRRKRSGRAFRPNRMAAVIFTRNEVRERGFAAAVGLANCLRPASAVRRGAGSCVPLTSALYL